MKRCIWMRAGLALVIQSAIEEEMRSVRPWKGEGGAPFSLIDEEENRSNLLKQVFSTFFCGGEKMGLKSAIIGTTFARTPRKRRMAL